MASDSSARFIRPVQEQDLPQLRRFFSAQMHANSMGPTPDEQYYRWKYFSRPHPELQSLSFVAIAQQEVVGFLGRMGRRFNVDGQHHVVTEGTDAFVAREHQGTGLFVRLMATARQAVRDAGVAFSTARPNHNSRPGALRSGHLKLSSLRMYARPLGPEPLLKRLDGRPRVQAFVNRTAGFALRATEGPAVYAGMLGLRCEPIRRFDERMDALWEASRSRFRIGVVRDRRYMNWRYIDCPTDFTVLGLFKADRLLAVAVAVVGGAGRGAADAELVDMISTGADSGPLAYVLLGQLMRRLAHRGVQVLRCFLLHHPALRGDSLRCALALHGFARRPGDEAPMLVRPESDEGATRQLLSLGYWHFRSGDSDIV